MPDILLLSEDNLLAEDLAEQIELNAPGFKVFRENDGTGHFDIIIVDEDEKKLKPLQTLKIPLFLLSSKEGDEQTFTANHTFFKPLHLSELLDDLHACVNRFENSCDGFLHFNQYELHPIGKEIVNLRNGRIIKLTEKEVAVIKYLYKNKTKIVSKNELLQEVWGYNPDVSTHTIETHIYRLRQKVEQGDDSAQLIITEDGGYKLKR